MNKQALINMIEEDKEGLLNIDYEICSGCGARVKIKAVSLRSAKTQATKLGFGIRAQVWIRGSNGNILATKESRCNSLWT